MKKTREENGLSEISEILSSLTLTEKTKRRIDEENLLKENSERIKEKYEVKTDEDILAIVKAEKEKDECEKCKGYPCIKRKNEGYIPEITIDKAWGVQIKLKECEKYERHKKQKALEEKYKESRIPLRYLGKKRTDYEADEKNKIGIEFAKRVLAESYSGAYFYGKVGTGKTYLAALIAQEFLENDKRVLFENVGDLLTEFYEIYRGQGKKTEQELLKKLYEVDLLILDDFGMEKATQFVGATLCKILDARYNNEGVTTLITSNYSIEQIRQRLDNPTDADKGELCLNGSRIHDRCMEICKTIHFKGESRRK